MAVFRQCFEVTFTYEHFLLALRRGAFDATKKCESRQSLVPARADITDRPRPDTPLACLHPPHTPGISLQQLDDAVQAAAASLPPQGWPVPPKGCLKQAVAQASRAQTYPCFSFGELVR